MCLTTSCPQVVHGYQQSTHPKQVFFFTAFHSNCHGQILSLKKMCSYQRQRTDAPLQSALRNLGKDVKVSFAPPSSPRTTREASHLCRTCVTFALFYTRHRCLHPIPYHTTSAAFQVATTWPPHVHCRRMGAGPLPCTRLYGHRHLN